MRHSHSAQYLAIISPYPACSIRMGASFIMAVSAMIATGQPVLRDTFTRFWIMEALLEA